MLKKEFMNTIEVGVPNAQGAEAGFLYLKKNLEARF